MVTMPGTEPVSGLLEHRYEFQACGEVKGEGPMPTFLAGAEKSALGQDGGVCPTALRSVTRNSSSGTP
jgi:hypothetical protein